jgi:hypothetical protein
VRSYRSRDLIASFRHSLTSSFVFFFSFRL